jgi:twitching motility two-component system response regulator PilH
VPLNVLLADDSVPAQNMGKKILMDAGYGVVTVSNGLEALRKIAEAVPDIAILDIFMPGYTGLEICKRLRSSAPTATVPVILTVGKLEPYRPEDGEQVQSNAVIVKPFSAAELISAVRSLIGAPIAETQAVRDEASAADPSRQRHSAAEDAVLPNLPTFEASATPAPQLETFQQEQHEEQDEPLFASRASEVGGEADLLSSQAPSAYGSVYGGDSLLSGADPAGPSSLAFDPDAKHTPFSASAIETLSPASHSAESVSGFGEFDLGADSSSYSALEPGMSAMEEQSLSASPAQEAAQAAGSAVIAESSVLEEGENPELSVSEFASVDVAADDVVPTSPEVQLSPEEEARLAAFEALFNSPEVLPLDNVVAPHDVAAPVELPSIAEAPKENAYGIEPELEIQPPMDDLKQHFALAGLDLNPLEEVQPESEPLAAIGTNADLLPGPLDDASTSTEWAQAGSAWKSEEPNASAPNELALPQFEPYVEESASSVPFHSVAPAALSQAVEVSEAVEAAPVAVQVHAEAFPEPSSIDDPAPSAEILQSEPEPAHEALQSGLEIGPLDLDTAQPEAVPIEASQPEPEPLHSEPGLALADAASACFEVAPVEPASVSAETAPVPVEIAPVEAAPLPGSTPVEVEPLELAHLQPEQPTEISSPPALSSRLNEAERIHQAIELVFDRFKPLLVAAIVRELARHD